MSAGTLVEFRRSADQVMGGVRIAFVAGAVVPARLAGSDPGADVEQDEPGTAADVSERAAGDPQDE